MQYQVKEVSPNYQERVMDVAVHCEDGNDLTFRVKNKAELTEILHLHDQFLSDLKDLEATVEEEAEAEASNADVPVADEPA